MSTTGLRIRVPATSANLGPGFDTLGMALQFYNRFLVRPAPAMAVVCAEGTCVDTLGMSLDPAENLLAKTYQSYFELRGDPLIPAHLEIEAHIPFSRGLGSSSTAIVAGLYLADAMHPHPLGKEALIPWAVYLEGHPDNVVPAILGGVQCCLEHGPAFRLSWPVEWGILLVVPPNPVSTREARTIMPPHYSRDNAVSTMRGLAAWVYAVEHRNIRLFEKALAMDQLHEPARSQLIPEYAAVKKLIASTSAMGCVISGSGSTIAIFTPYPDAHRAVRLLVETAPELSHCKIMSLRPDTTGVMQVS